MFKTFKRCRFRGGPPWTEEEQMANGKIIIVVFFTTVACFPYIVLGAIEAAKFLIAR